MPGSQVNRGPDRRMLRRILALCVLFGLLAFPALILRLYRLQITDHEYYEALAIGQQLREAPTVIARGGIYDRSLPQLLGRPGDGALRRGPDRPRSQRAEGGDRRKSETREAESWSITPISSNCWISSTA